MNKLQQCISVAILNELQIVDRTKQKIRSAADATKRGAVATGKAGALIGAGAGGVMAAQHPEKIGQAFKSTKKALSDMDSSGLAKKASEWVNKVKEAAE